VAERYNALMDGLRIVPPVEPNALLQPPMLADAWTHNAQAATDWMERERQISRDRGLWTGGGLLEGGRPTQAGVVDAVRQYGNAVLMGTTAPKGMPVYRGQYRGTEPSGNFFSEDREFAKQFTRRGLDEEVIVRHIDPAAVYHPQKPVYAGDEAAVDAAIAEAKVKGLRAVRLSEAKGSAPGETEPASIFVFDKSALTASPGS